MTRTAATRRQINNLVVNGDFEYAPAFTAVQTGNNWIDGTAGGSASVQPYRWGVFSKFGTVAASFDSTQSNSGTYSMKLSTTATNSSANARQAIDFHTYVYSPFGIALLPSTAYTCTFWMKTNLTSGSSAAGAYLAVQVTNGDSSTTQTKTSTKILTTTAWTQYTVSFTTTSTQVLCHIEVILDGTAGSANLLMDAWFDDIVLGLTTPITRTSA